MNWLHFLSGLGALYAIYYLAVILIDMASGRNGTGAGPVSHELTFSENVIPLQPAEAIAQSGQSGFKSQPDLQKGGQKKEPEMMGSGGVVIDNLFRLCKQEAIIYTRSVSF